jgi:hypothetical protein
MTNRNDNIFDFNQAAKLFDNAMHNRSMEDASRFSYLMLKRAGEIENGAEYCKAAFDAIAQVEKVIED